MIVPPKKNATVSDSQLEEMLLSLREEDHSDQAKEKPPVINTFRLEVEAERRRSRIQLEIVTIAAFVSVLSTVVLTAFFFRFILPDLIAHSNSRIKEFFILFKTETDTAVRQFGSLFIVLALAVLLGYIISAVLLITNRDVLFTKKE